MSEDVYDKDQSILAKYVFMADNLSNHHAHNLLDETDNKKNKGINLFATSLSKLGFRIENLFNQFHKVPKFMFNVVVLI